MVRLVMFVLAIQQLLTVARFAAPQIANPTFARIIVLGGVLNFEGMKWHAASIAQALGCSRVYQAWLHGATALVRASLLVSVSPPFQPLNTRSVVRATIAMIVASGVLFVIASLIYVLSAHGLRLPLRC